MRTRLPRSAALGLISLAAFVAGMGVARAHAAYESSDPSNGATVENPPSRVTAEFTEPVVSESTLSVFDPCGTQVDNRDSIVAGDRITVSMSADKQGTYTVRFDVVSSVDGHPTNGTFDFTSAGGSPCPGAEPAEEEEEEKTTASGAQQSGSGTTSGGKEPVAPRGGNEETSQTETRLSSKNNEGAMKDARVAGTRIRSESDAEPLLAQEQERVEPTGLFGGMRWGSFAVALLIAAAIGAAGGRIYAGIMGPRR